jgi:hypothetical protein
METAVVNIDLDSNQVSLISQPVVLAEVSPGHYNLIDGQHRVEKARRAGVGRIKAYKLTVLQHIAFLTSKKAYLCYVEYWNSKAEEIRLLGKADAERCIETPETARLNPDFRIEKDDFMHTSRHGGT